MESTGDYQALNEKGQNGCDPLVHLRVLLWKQWVTHKRSPRGIICIAIAPFCVCLFMVFAQFIANSQLDSNIYEPVVSTISAGIDKCFDGEGLGPCVSLGYGFWTSQDPTNVTVPEWVEHTLGYVQKHTGMEYGNDIAPIWNGSNLTEYENYFADNFNRTQFSILFCAGSVTYFNTSVDCEEFPPFFLNTKVYFIMYNTSLVPNEYQTDPKLPYPVYDSISKLKAIIDSGIADFYYQGEDEVAPMQVEIQNYPSPKIRFAEGVDVVDADGILYFFIAPMVVFVIMIGEMANEKDKKLRQGLTVVGVSHFTYYLSWAALGIVYGVVLATTMTLSGWILQFEVFTQTPFWLFWIVFFLFTVAMAFFSMFMYSIAGTSKQANTLAYALLLVGFVFQILLANPQLLDYIYDEDNSTQWKVIIYLFNFYPPFHFARIYGSIASLSGNHFSNIEGRWVAGPGYDWDDLNLEITGIVNTNETFVIPAPKWALFWLLIDMAFYSGIIWYLDHVISHNRGSADSFYFFLTPTYWKNVFSIKKKVKVRSSLNSSAELGEETNPNKENQEQNINTVQKEKLRVLGNAKVDRPADGIRVRGLSKVYKKYSCGCKSKSDVHALNEVYLEVPQGELMCLLGHNGAGKTTLINILTGVLGDFTGNATIANYDLTNNKDLVKQSIGVCPQFDILWNDMTAKEHLWMFARIKGLNKKIIPTAIERYLEDVNLADVGDHMSKTFSGGMKRRLSMAIAAIGNPGIIFLDEPTTGMDPKSRRQVWELIKKLKIGRSVILTTHAMEEADALSDRIAVIVDGQFKCIGTSLYLKNTFGEGYRLTLVVNPDVIEEAKEIVRDKIPSARLLDDSGGSLVFSIPVLRIQELQTFFMIIENKDDEDAQSKRLKALVSDWGLSHTTLEEVFMKVTGKKKQRKRLSTVDFNHIKTAKGE